MKSKPAKAPRKRKGGRPLIRVKIEGDWVAAVDTALSRPKPAGGWPKPPASR